jgi:anti-anti-sigma factor
MDLKMDQTRQEGILTIGGSLTIYRSTELKNTLATALQTSDIVRVNLDKVTEIDLACLQVLISAHKTSLKRNKKLIFSSNYTDILKKSFRVAGFVHLVKKKITDNK